MNKIYEITFLHNKEKKSYIVVSFCLLNFARKLMFMDILQNEIEFNLNDIEDLEIKEVLS